MLMPGNVDEKAEKQVHAPLALHDDTSGHHGFYFGIQEPLHPKIVLVADAKDRQEQERRLPP